VRLARFAGARLILDRVTGLDRGARLIHLAGRPPLPYDLAALDIGITSDLPDLPGAAEHAVAAKPLGRYAAAWESFVASRHAFPRVAILGAGLGGVELALATAHRLGQGGGRGEITLLDSSDAPLATLSRAARGRVLAQLAAAGVILRFGVRAAAIGPAGITLTNGEEISADFSLTATGARPQGWLTQTGLALDRGFVQTDATLQSSDPQIFAVGDCATIAGNPRPKAGVFAVRAAPVLYHNLIARLTGQPLQSFRPQRDYLKLVSLGNRSALAEKWRLVWSGAAAWRLKDRIDRRFMAQFDGYPAMGAETAPQRATIGLDRVWGQQPLCGGCGAKLGPDVLALALSTLPAPTRPEVRSGPGDDAAILTTAAGVQVLTTDHLRAFTHDPRLLARIAALHAMGDVWAMGAAPQVAVAQVILPRLGPDLQSRMLQDIMTEAAATFRVAGADVVGGHSSEGAELSVGFTVTGLAERAVTKSGARPGDALILTKPLGSGVILAAEMAMAVIPGQLLGEVWANCIAQMCRPQGSAAAILAPHAHAMTDVTGFGLAGHLLEMLTTGATLRSSAIPLMPGALALAKAGHRASLQPANSDALKGRITAPDDPGLTLLSDPQTCGGLLAAVPADAAIALVAQICRAGHDAAIIGTVTQGDPHLTILP